MGARFAKGRLLFDKRSGLNIQTADALNAGSS